MEIDHEISKCLIISVDLLFAFFYERGRQDARREEDDFYREPQRTCGKNEF